MDTVSRECVVTVETLFRWRDDSITAGIARPKPKSLKGVPIAAFEKKIGEEDHI